MSILFGKVHSLDILPGKNGDNFPSAVYWFNYCIAGECSDPDAFSDKIGVAEIHLAPDGRKIYQLPGPDLIVGAKSATGLALCGVTSEYRVVGQECYQVPTTFDELRAKFSSSGGQIDGVALQYARLWKSGNNAEWSKVLDALRGAESYYVAHCHSEQYSSEERLIHLTDSHVVCD